MLNLPGCNSKWPTLLFGCPCHKIHIRRARDKISTKLVRITFGCSLAWQSDWVTKLLRTKELLKFEADTSLNFESEMIQMLPGLETFRAKRNLATSTLPGLLILWDSSSKGNDTMRFAMLSSSGCPSRHTSPRVGWRTIFRSSTAFPRLNNCKFYGMTVKPRETCSIWTY